MVIHIRINMCVCVHQHHYNWSVYAQSCSTLCNTVGCSLPGSSVHGIFHRQEYWSVLPLPTPGESSQGTNMFLFRLLHWQVDVLPLAPPRKTKLIIIKAENRLNWGIPPSGLVVDFNICLNPTKVLDLLPGYYITNKTNNNNVFTYQVLMIKSGTKLRSVNKVLNLRMKTNQ